MSSTSVLNDEIVKQGQNCLRYRTFVNRAMLEFKRAVLLGKKMNEYATKKLKNSKSVSGSAALKGAIGKQKEISKGITHLMDSTIGKGKKKISPKPKAAAKAPAPAKAATPKRFLAKAPEKPKTAKKAEAAPAKKTKAAPAKKAKAAPAPAKKAKAAPVKKGTAAKLTAVEKRNKAAAKKANAPKKIESAKVIDARLAKHWKKDMATINHMITESAKAGQFNVKQSGQFTLNLKRLGMHLSRRFTDASAIKKQYASEVHMQKKQTFDMINRIEKVLMSKIVAAGSWFKKHKAMRKLLINGESQMRKLSKVRKM